MSKGLEALERLMADYYEMCQDLGNNDDQYQRCNLTSERAIIEKELKDYQEIREIAKRYNWDDITGEIFNVKTDEKYRDLFNSAIVDIQKDYRKARVFEVIKNKRVNIDYLRSCKSLEDYNNILIEKWQLTQKEYDLLKKELE